MHIRIDEFQDVAKISTQETSRPHGRHPVPKTNVVRARIERRIFEIGFGTARTDDIVDMTMDCLELLSPDRSIEFQIRAIAFCVVETTPGIPDIMGPSCVSCLAGIIADALHYPQQHARQETRHARRHHVFA